MNKKRLLHKLQMRLLKKKNKQNQQVDAQLTQGNQNIENAQSIDDVNTAKDNAIQAIAQFKHQQMLKRMQELNC